MTRAIPLPLLSSRPAAVPTTVTIPETRYLVQIRAGLGAAHLVVPGLVGGLLVGRALDHRARVIIRVLGARQLAQAAATAVQPTAAVHALGAEADAAHALSMVTLGLLSHRWRRAAFADAVLAAGFAVAGVAAARSRGRLVAPVEPRAPLERWADQLADRLVPGYQSRGADPDLS